jgi:hypothetical protein
MKSKIACFLFIPVIFLAVSCSSKPEIVQEQVAVVSPQLEARPQPEVNPQPEAGLQPEVNPPSEEVFDPGSISRAQFDSTMDEVQKFIEELNRIIGTKNYRAWRAVLSPEYLNEISSPENLRQISDQPAMKTRRIVLKTAEDYFTHVVVPSRANSHVDDIEFFGRNRVKAFSISTNRAGEVQRLRLYDLEKNGNSWIIIN